MKNVRMALMLSLFTLGTLGACVAPAQEEGEASAQTSTVVEPELSTLESELTGASTDCPVLVYVCTQCGPFGSANDILNPCTGEIVQYGSCDELCF